MGLKLLLLLVVVGVLIHWGAGRIERALMYFPDPEHVSPQAYGLAGVREIVITAPDGARVVAWYGTASPGQPVLLYFHGNAGSLASRSERIRKYHAQGYGIFMMSYRGFSGSTGQPSEAANLADATRAYQTLRAEGVAPSDIVLYGESLGSGIATQIAAANPVAGVILDAPYTSMLDLARLHHPHLPAALFLKDRYSSAAAVPRVTAPILIVHGEKDDVVPVAMGREMYRLANEPKTIVTYPMAGHSDHHLNGSYDTIFGWLSARQRVGAGASGVSGRAPVGP